jgi:hypothetical protein
MKKGYDSNGRASTRPWVQFPVPKRKIILPPHKRQFSECGI